MKVALVYDRVNKLGGAERVLMALHEMFPDAPLYTSVFNPSTASWAKSISIIPSFLQQFPFATQSHELYPLLMPIAFESFSFAAYDLVISVTSEAAKGIITGPKTKHICYCLTPTRYLWSGYDTYFPSPIIQTLATPAVAYLRQWDMVAARRPDHLIAISKEVQARIKKYYERSAPVIYPPVVISSKSKMKSAELKIPDNGYFLVVSRLVPYKRIDIAIEACNVLGLPLKIVGVGSESARLRKKAGPTIEFVGSLTDDQLVQYYNGCKALLFPGIEDFGLVIIEAQRFGKPVLAFHQGGAKETIQKGVTGDFFYTQNAQALIQLLETFQEKNYKAEDCRKQAEKFSKERFKQHFSEYIESVVPNI